MTEHYTALADEGRLVRDGADAVEEARKLHHLATADPDYDGGMTGPKHEDVYDLERAPISAELWQAVGVHPMSGKALVGDEAGSENVRGATGAEGAGGVETTKHQTKAK